MYTYMQTNNLGYWGRGGIAPIAPLKICATGLRCLYNIVVFVIGNTSGAGTGAREQCHRRGPLSAPGHCVVDRRRRRISIIAVIRPEHGSNDGRVAVIVLGVLAVRGRHRQTAAGQPRRVRLPGRRARDHHPVRTDALRTGDRGPDEQTVR